jgi:histone H3/H4
MANSFFSLSSVSNLLKKAAPGAYTPESVLKAREIAEDTTKEIAKIARELANNAGKKRVTENEIKLAAKYFLKN